MNRKAKQILIATFACLTVFSSLTTVYADAKTPVVERDNTGVIHASVNQEFTGNVDSMYSQEKYAFDNEITFDGKKFKLKDSSQIVGEMKKEKLKLQGTVEHKNLYEKEIVPGNSIVLDSGETALLKEVTFQESIITERTANVTGETVYHQLLKAPIPEKEKAITYFDENTKQNYSLSIPLTNVEQITEWKWVGDLRIPIKVEIYNALYYKMGTELISHNKEKPLLIGYEKYILNELGLNQQSYRINDFVWEGEEYEVDGVLYRNAIASGERLIADFKAVYANPIASLPNAKGYTAIATYETEKEIDSGTYTILSTAIYDELPEEKVSKIFPTVLVVGVSIGAILIILLMVAILYIVSKKKKEGRDRNGSFDSNMD